MFIKPSKVYVSDSQVHGRGVYAISNIHEEETIEKCPMIKLDFSSKYHCDLKILDYVYAKPCKPCEQCKNHGYDLYMIMGYGMVYNHQDNANAIISFDYVNLIAEITAIKDIKADSEIFISYGPMYFINKKKIELDHAENY
jgi:SET domain-containing protein